MDGCAKNVTDVVSSVTRMSGHAPLSEFATNAIMAVIKAGVSFAAVRESVMRIIAKNVPFKKKIGMVVQR